MLTGFCVFLIIQEGGPLRAPKDSHGRSSQLNIHTYSNDMVVGPLLGLTFLVQCLPWIKVTPRVASPPLEP